MTLAGDTRLIRARQCPSPNCDLRPPGCVIDLLVIHSISLPPGRFGDGWIDDLFLNRLDPDAHPYFRDICRLRVSSHLLIRRGGELVQYVPLDRRAWHAGVSAFRGRTACNDFSIGIELEGDDETPFTDAQYHTLIQTIADIRELYPTITPDRIVGHSDIAPGRKTDPGPCFDWGRIGIWRDHPASGGPDPAPGR
ncbi:MAG TPA: 1,6-anhydro-N-acetylmuramyl-L-alanine amidase AmpD [Sedimenticola sp.]|nr:1,6-anhydro-N-acetylmuramyl-L-alanine amidase AmpD [Sedimenticola sp.]